MLATILAFAAVPSQSQMNSKVYTIANPLANTTKAIQFRGKYFEIYGSWQTTHYSYVDWHGDPTSLPADIVAQYANKTIAITGYEVNIVRNDTNGKEEEVPAYELYNHHYSGSMSGAAVEMVEHDPERMAPAAPGSHGGLAPQFRFVVPHVSQQCSLEGVWLNVENSISVNVTATKQEGVYTAACVGPRGWKDATITMQPPSKQYPQGTVDMDVKDSTASATKGYITTYASTPASPSCTQLTWPSGGNYVREPYARNNKPAAAVGVPHAQAFSEGNGNEHRNSYKGYASGFAQLVHSPKMWSNNAMIINTNKRLTNDKSPGPIGGPQPTHSLAPAGADYQGILECPCTTRKTKVIDGYLPVTEGVCGTRAIETPAECTHSGVSLGLPVSNTTTVTSPTSPAGCFIAAGASSMTFNTHKEASGGAVAGGGDPAVECGGNPADVKSRPLVGSSLVGTVNVQMHLDSVAKVATITLSCKANNVWFGVGFNTTTMAAASYTVVVDGAGKVTEHKLGPHTPGTELPSPFATVVSSTQNTTTGVRVVVLTAPFAAAAAPAEWTAPDAAAAAAPIDFGSLVPGEVEVITAIGSAATFSYHKSHSNGQVLLGHLGAPTCICRDPTSNSGTISGMRFNPGVCAPFPVGELQSTHNAICNITEYNGGLFCCHDQSVLIDADQDYGPGLDTWRMKYRFYYEDYDSTATRNTFRVWTSTEAYNNEYDVPKSSADCLDPSTPPELCTHTIKANFTGKMFVAGPSACMVGGDPAACGDVNKIQKEAGGWFQMTYAAFHCHAPACISGELWNVDTGELICRNVAEYGSGLAPSDEKGYVVGIPPCVWGSAADGLQAPPRIHLDSNLTTIKRANSTNGHWGVMALWQARAAYL